MLEFVRLFHEAFHTESRWVFVLSMALGSALVFGIAAGGLAFVVDTAYQRKMRQERPTPNTATAAQTAVPAASTPTFARIKFSSNPNIQPELIEERNIFRWYNLGHVSASKSTMKAVQAFWTVYLTFDQAIPLKEIVVRGVDSLYEVKDSSPRSAIVEFYPGVGDTIITIEARN